MRREDEGECEESTADSVSDWVCSSIQRTSFRGLLFSNSTLMENKILEEISLGSSLCFLCRILRRDIADKLLPPTEKKSLLMLSEMEEEEEEGEEEEEEEDDDKEEASNFNTRQYRSTIMCSRGVEGTLEGNPFS